MALTYPFTPLLTHVMSCMWCGVVRCRHERGPPRPRHCLRGCVEYAAVHHHLRGGHLLHEPREYQCSVVSSRGTVAVTHVTVTPVTVTPVTLVIVAVTPLLTLCDPFLDTSLLTLFVFTYLPLVQVNLLYWYVRGSCVYNEQPDAARVRSVC